MDKEFSMEHALQLSFYHRNEDESFETLEIIHFTQLYIKGTVRMYMIDTVSICLSHNDKTDSNELLHPFHSASMTPEVTGF